MSEFQRELLDMTDDEVEMTLANILSDLADISTAVDKSYIVAVTPGKIPVLITNGEIDTSLRWDSREAEIPAWFGMDVNKGLDSLSIREA